MRPSERLKCAAKNQTGVSLTFLGVAMVVTGLAACGIGEGDGDTPTGVADETFASTAQAITIGPEGHALEYFKCADEGGSCVVGQYTYVAFGANGQFLYRSSPFHAKLPCDRATFGGDPAPGVVKACYASNYADRLTPEGSWDYPGAGPINIAYGANGKFNFRMIEHAALDLSTGEGGYHCDNDTFGDPIVGVRKACYSAVSDYFFAAWERDTVQGLVNQAVAYGANGKFVFKVHTGDAPCTNDFFESDPAPTITKACYVLRLRQIADEGQSLNVKPNTWVFYGSGLNGNFITSAFPTARCTNDQFGGDPYPTVFKHCWQ